jgi:iron complex outermembrane receptor protein
MCPHEDKTMNLAPLSLAVAMLAWLAPAFAQMANQRGAPAESSDCAASGACTMAEQKPRRLAQAGVTYGRTAAAAREISGSKTVQTLEEVIVTAQKREQRLIDVPVPVTAISGPTLVENNEVRIQDYFQTIPGVNFTTDLNGGAIISIRGLTTGFSNPTTSITIDGVPYGSSSAYGGAFALLPDIDPSDLARLEVLRGPQGTLYGAASLGGLINYVTVDPSTDRLSGRVETDLSKVQNGADLGYAVRAAANVPISDSVALRVSGFDRRTPGYIDNVLTGQKSTNRIDAEGGRASLLIRPSDRWSLKLSALYQNNEGYGQDFAIPALGDLKQDNIPGTGTYHSDIQAYSAILKASLGAAEFTALSGYNVNSIHDTQDQTNSFEALAQQFFGVGGTTEFDHQRISKATQELRLSMPLGQRLDWLFGLFYTYEKANANQQWWATDIASGAILPTGNMLNGTWPTTYTEYAAFTDLTVHFTDRFDVQFGGRESGNRQTYSEIDGGGYTTVFGISGAPAPLVTPEVDTKDNSFTYLVTPRYKFSPNVMVYARLATGYRPGGPNPTCSAFDLPCHFDPDRTRDSEIGMKGDVFDHRLDFDASVFYIDWKHIQVSTNPACMCASLFVNAGSAKSQGVELSLQGRPVHGLTLSGWVDFTDAVLTASFPTNSSAIGGSGDRLPFSSRLSGNFSAEWDTPISNRTDLVVGGQISYVGNRIGNFEYLPQRPYYPAYAEAGVRAGVLVDDWRITAFDNNLTNRRGVLGGYLPLPYGGNGYAYIQPRTIGIAVERKF